VGWEMVWGMPKLMSVNSFRGVGSGLGGGTGPKCDQDQSNWSAER
jgi:hypothetical protein